MAFECNDCHKEVDTGSDDPRPGTEIAILRGDAAPQLCSPCYEKAKAVVDAAVSSN